MRGCTVHRLWKCSLIQAVISQKNPCQFALQRCHHRIISLILYIMYNVYFLSYRSIHVDAICPRHMPQIPLQTKQHQNPADVSMVGCIVFSLSVIMSGRLVWFYTASLSSELFSSCSLTIQTVGKINKTLFSVKNSTQYFFSVSKDF